MGQSVDALAPESLLSNTCIPALLDSFASVAPVCIESTICPLVTGASLRCSFNTSTSRRCDPAIDRNTKLAVDAGILLTLFVPKGQLTSIDDAVLLLTLIRAFHDQTKCSYLGRSV